MIIRTKKIKKQIIRRRCCGGGGGGGNDQMLEGNILDMASKKGILQMWSLVDLHGSSSTPEQTTNPSLNGRPMSDLIVELSLQIGLGIFAFPINTELCTAQFVLQH